MESEFRCKAPHEFGAVMAELNSGRDIPFSWAVMLNLPRDGRYIEHLVKATMHLALGSIRGTRTALSSDVGKKTLFLHHYVYVRT